MPARRASGMDSWDKSIPKLSVSSWMTESLVIGDLIPWYPMFVWGLGWLGPNPREESSYISVLSFKWSWWTRHASVSLISLTGRCHFGGFFLKQNGWIWCRELAGFIFTREYHHLTQIFGWPLQATRASISMFDNRSVSLWLCGLDRGIRFNIITDLGIHKSDHESWVISASWSMLQAFGVSSSSKHLWLPNFIPSPQRIPGNRSSTRLQKHVRWCLADLYKQLSSGSRMVQPPDIQTQWSIE